MSPTQCEAIRLLNAADRAEASGACLRGSSESAARRSRLRLFLPSPSQVRKRQPESGGTERANEAGILLKLGDFQK